MQEKKKIMNNFVRSKNVIKRPQQGRTGYRKADLAFTSKAPNISQKALSNVKRGANIGILVKKSKSAPGI